MSKPAPKVATATLDATLACMRTPPGGAIDAASLDAARLLEHLEPRCQEPRELLELIGELLDVAHYVGVHAKAAGVASTLTHEVIPILAERLAARADATLPPGLRARVRDGVREQTTTMPKPRGRGGVSIRTKRR